RRVDRAGKVELVRRTFTREFAQTPQCDLDVARTQFDRVVEVAILARVPDLYRRAIARLLLADADALGVVAVRAEGRRAARADPLVAALVAALLLLQPLLERLHQLFPAAERLDLLFLLLREGQLDLLQQPLERHLRLDAGNRLDALPELAEGAVELVVVRLVLNECGARQVIELVHRGTDDVLAHRLEQRQVLLDGDGQPVALELEEEIDQHAAYCK